MFSFGTSHHLEENTQVILSPYRVNSCPLIHNDQIFSYSTELYSTISTLPLETAQCKTTEKYLITNNYYPTNSIIFVPRVKLSLLCIVVSGTGTSILFPNLGRLFSSCIFLALCGDTGAVPF